MERTTAPSKTPTSTGHARPPVPGPEAVVDVVVLYSENSVWFASVMERPDDIGEPWPLSEKALAPGTPQAPGSPGVQVLDTRGGGAHCAAAVGLI